jgi:hypothetical protein
MDRHTGAQIWNHPIAGYRIEPPRPADYLGLHPESTQVYRMNLTLTLWWVRDDVPAGIETPPFRFEDGPAYQSRTLKMELWLDGPVTFDDQGHVQSSGEVLVFRDKKSGRIYGGDWRMGDQPGDHAWPDYLWVPRAISASSGYANPEIDLGWIRAQLF